MVDTGISKVDGIELIAIGYGMDVQVWPAELDISPRPTCVRLVRSEEVASFENGCANRISVLGIA